MIIIRIQDQIDIIIRDIISPFFKEKNFKKVGRNYFKLYDDFGFTFNIQSSQFNTKDSVRFTFNIGIFIPSAYRLNRGEDPPKRPKTIDCLNPLRIGFLKGIGDNWYEINEMTDISIIKQEIEQDLLSYVFPFYNKFNSVDNIIDISIESLKSGERIFHEMQLCTILISQGKRGKGEQLFIEYYNKRKKTKHSIENLVNYADKLHININTQK
ncbi:DUF4304 domain-containing protein [Paenibacillus glycanilyticus]|uniref:DUF4304 domain-containing protein n=1 Tax=Paenibacillus glycanilyticus TaxID=126569 RepID=A0ABQ6GEE3_9BACL|nr:DUF4304 domain-containing protein [Paenibacillus glycanilyticus]GLX68012.1 hypothetical protein MU1_23570 [Paenibacillus glycanilyticus]